MFLLILVFFCEIQFGYSFEVEKFSENEYPIPSNLCKNNLTNSQDIEKYNVSVTNDITLGVLQPFWKSTGLCPPDPHEESHKFLLSKDMQQNLFHIGTLPHKGITQVRMHWMLDLVQMRILFDMSATYNFSYLDELIFDLWKNGLHPGFELMGNPSNYFTDFENTTQVYLWRNLVQAIGEHYIELYGIEYLKEWNFETWNEPDHHDFDKLNITQQGFLNYYDACSEGLKLANKLLRFGGPGGSCHIPSTGHSPLCWSLLDHCVNGKNFFTGETGIRMNFISFHKKGNASSQLIFEDEIKTIKYIREKFPALAHVPIYNDESDPMKNWALSKWWRADCTYAAMVVKIILNHALLYFTRGGVKVNFTLLSNDNAFLSYFPNQFTERTLLARFQVNNTSPKFVEYVKKPVYAVFGLLSKLCKNIMNFKLHRIDGKNKEIANNFGIVATQCATTRRFEIVIILYNSRDSNHSNTAAEVNLSINISKSTARDLKWIVLELNNRKSNPYAVWLMLGKPAYPSMDQFKLMKNMEHPDLRGPWNITSHLPWMFDLTVFNPGVSLINICQKQGYPKKVRKIRFLQAVHKTLQIVWQDDYNRCILTYNVEYSLNKCGPFKQINANKVIFPSYWHACVGKKHCNIKGFYRIYAVDYWNQTGPYSNAAFFNP